VERTRLIKFFLDRNVTLKAGMSVLHVAPEMGLSKYFLSIPGLRYKAVDLFPDIYRHCRVERMDLVTDAEKLSANSYDLILHSHVMEHIPSNVTMVLLHLHRALKESGRHIFSIPIYLGSYEECLAEIGPEERRRRFHQEDHVRRFGRDDIDLTIGKIFNISEEYDLVKKYPDVDFSEFNIPRSALSGYTSNTIFCLRKTDLKL
jgi:phosphoglycolate phosphatase